MVESLQVRIGDGGTLEAAALVGASGEEEVRGWLAANARALSSAGVGARLARAGNGRAVLVVSLDPARMAAARGGAPRDARLRRALQREWGGAPLAGVAEAMRGMAAREAAEAFGASERTWYRIRAAVSAAAEADPSRPFDASGF